MVFGIIFFLFQYTFPFIFWNLQKYQNEIYLQYELIKSNLTNGDKMKLLDWALTFAQKTNKIIHKSYKIKNLRIMQMKDI